MGAGVGTAIGAPLNYAIQKYKSAAIADLSIEERESCMRNGFVVIDKRAADEKTPLYTEDYKSRFGAPDRSGIFEIVNRAGSLEKALVAVSPFLIDQPRSRFNSSITVDPASGVFYLLGPDEQVFVRSRLSTEDNNWEEAIKGTQSIKQVVPQKTYMLVGKNGEFSAPFRVLNKISSKGSMSLTCETIGEVSWRTHRHHSGPFGGPCSSGPANGTIIKLVDREDSDTILEVGSIVYVPTNWKVLELEPESTRLGYSYFDAEKEGDKIKLRKIFERIMPGGSATLTAALLNKNLFCLGLNKQGSRLVIQVADYATPELDKQAAVNHLVVNLGLSVPDALECWRAGQAGSTDRWVDLSKVAASMHDQIYTGTPFPADESQLGVNNSGVMETQPVVQRQTIQMNHLGDPSHDWRDNDQANWDRIKPVDQDFLLRAANSGSQPVFDAAMIGSLLSTNRPIEQSSEWLPDLVSGLDSKSRLLLSFYWHNGAFSSVYGNDSLAEFEDVLLSAIKMDGKVILFLKQKAGESSSSNVDALASE